MDNNLTTSKILKKCLSLVIVCTIPILILFLISIFIKKPLGSAIIYASIVILASGIFLFQLYELRCVICTVLDKNPFIEKNIKRFKNIGNCTFLLGIFNILNNQHPKHFLIIIDIGFFSIDDSIFVYIILGCLSLILAEIFKAALKIKNENDLTI